MSTMADQNSAETYNGYANRETWAFNLYWQNDQGLYLETLEWARVNVPHDASDSQVGEQVVSYWRDVLDEIYEDRLTPVKKLVMFDREVGSWWRIDYREVGEAVRESLDAES